MVPSALMIGSMGPDFAYYLPLPVDRSQSHGALALLWFVLPLGLLIYALWHGLMREPLTELLPPGIRARVRSIPANPTPWSASRLPTIAFCLLLGGVTHLMWDSFTHGGGWFVERFDTLQAEQIEIGTYHLFGYKILQHGSSLLGLGCLAWWLRGWLSKQPAPAPEVESAVQTRRRRAIVGLVLIASLALGLRTGLMAPEKKGWLTQFQYFAGPFYVTTMSTVGALLLTYCCLHQVRSK